jgi:hypothetical protein
MLIYIYIYIYIYIHTHAHTGDAKGEQLALNSVGINWYKLGEFEKAIDVHNQHLQMADIPGKFVVCVYVIYIYTYIYIYVYVYVYMCSYVYECTYA